MDVGDVVGDIASAALEPFQQAMDLGAKLMDVIAAGVEWSADQIDELGVMMGELAAAIGALQAAASGDADGGADASG